MGPVPYIALIATLTVTSHLLASVLPGRLPWSLLRLMTRTTFLLRFSFLKTSFWMGVQGAQLEPAMGPVPYIALIATLTVTSHLLVVLLSFLGASFIPLLAGGFYSGCSVGFSAVIFALKVVLNVNSPGTQRIAGIAVPTKVGVHPLAVECLGKFR